LGDKKESVYGNTMQPLRSEDDLFAGRRLLVRATAAWADAGLDDDGNVGMSLPKLPGRAIPGN
jgi:hypothetical protein